MKTLAQIHKNRIDHKIMELIFAGEPFPDHVTPEWLRDNVPSPLGGWSHLAPRAHVIATLIYDDGSHLDVLKGAVFAW